MAVINKDSEAFVPYARLLNIIGDQLITDKKVAVIEVIKNSYDADATNVKVKFFNLNNYGKDYLPINERPYIEIWDDGDGMTLDIIKNVWLRPATPNKLTKKKDKDNLTTKGRTIQGEKGIGRFAIHKLGEKIDVYTKTKDENEVKLEMDFTEFDPEKASLFNQPKEYKLLDKVLNNWYVNDPPEKITASNGTLIQIFNLREEWNSKKDLTDLFKAILRLMPPVDENAGKLGIKFIPDFDIQLLEDNELFASEQIITFKDVIERAPYSMFGSVSNEGKLDFTYKSTSPQRNFKKSINLLSQTDLSNNNYTPSAIAKGFDNYQRKYRAGEFKFTFYAFDLKKPDKLILNKAVSEFIKDNFVYVLRDGVRVYPYGEKGYDWLNLDKLRSTVRAGDFISYNDLTGFVYITQDGNPLLKDSTNRQGIMDIDGALQDFNNIITGITEIFNTEIKIDKSKLELNRNISYADSNQVVQNSFNALKISLEKIDDKDALEKANKFLATVNKQNILLKERVTTVEDLAGLGMAVEKASHDALMLLSRMRANVKDFKKKVDNQNFNVNALSSLLQELDENLNFVYEEMQVIQPLFKNQRKTIQDISLNESIEKVLNYFRREIENKIEINFIKDDDFVVKTNTGLILQVLINLLDNAIYWVRIGDSIPKRITIKLNSKTNTLIIADNGPGIREDVEPIVYNEFFSLKADGRGLGLYIVKEILLRINAEIAIITKAEDKLLSGANFIIHFDKE